MTDVARSTALGREITDVSAQVGAPAGDGVLASDAAATGDDAVEVGLQDQLRAGLAVPVAVDPCLGILPEVGLER